MLGLCHPGENLSPVLQGVTAVVSASFPS
jgi:hypothetical protein